MTEEAQRIAIAEAMNLRVVSIANGIPLVVNSRTVYHDFDPLSNLNACHEMEKVLRPIKQERYCRLLREKVGSYDVAIHATAPQRCEAFLRTLNLWEETK